MSDEVEHNPELEALQAELSRFRKTPFRLNGSEIEQAIGDQVQKHGNSKSMALCFVGIPGGGKSKLIEKVSRHYNVDATHVRDLAKTNPEIRKVEKEFYRLGEVIPGIERDFLDFAFAKRQQVYLIDGFPRTLFQALEIYRVANEKKVKIKLVEIRMQPDREIFQSYYRQTQRALHRVKKGLLFGQAQDEEEVRIKAKIKRTLELDLYVIETLRSLGADIISLDGTPGTSKMFNEFKNKMGIKSSADEGSKS